MPSSRPGPLPFWRTRASNYAVGVGLPLFVVFAGAQLALPAFVFEHVMIVLVVGLAVWGGRGPAIAAAIAGGIGDNILLQEPVGQPAITGIRDALDLGLFLVMAVVVGWLVDRLRTAKAQALDAADRERQARETLDRLIATVAHDLATPLSAIQGTIQFARKHAQLPDIDAGRLLVRVETAAARATSLVRALADAQSIERDALALNRRRIDLEAVVEPIVRMLDRLSDRHPIVLAIRERPCIIHGDADRLGRVVENLITNAIKYSPAGGAVEVCLHRSDPLVILTVRDHGIGVPEGLRHRIFELGFRAPHAAQVAPGLGLGLYTATEIVRRHGGSITVEPGDDGGTIFTIRLPLADDPEATRADAGAADDPLDSPPWQFARRNSAAAARSSLATGPHDEALHAHRVG